MADIDTHELEALLQRCDAQGAMPPLSDGDTSAWVAGVSGALGADAAAGSEKHADLATLQDWARQRQELGQDWETPAHLGTCALCLEAFEVVLEASAAPPASLERFASLARGFMKGVPALGRARSGIAGRIGRRGWAWAAVLALALLLGWQMIPSTTRVRLEKGALFREDGRSLPLGQTLPGATLVLAREQVSTGMADGTMVQIEPQTHFSVRESLLGHTTLYLRDGQVEAAVAKQPPGQSFRVRTDLGLVTVVGTRFNVSSRQEAVEIYQTQDQTRASQSYQTHINRVTISVSEGKVKVYNQYSGEEALVSAGQTAILREKQPRIELSGGGR